ncbi:MAG: PHP domain-containing protein [Methanobacteriaceae archaeon]|jgi:predicted metal-dependent phosphoesterase TrpH|nr:PHP domain-containing protein [Candidatus Methanorudis spinitermitis]
MNLDSHIHSCYSGDSRSKPKNIINQAIFIGLDIIAISDHNTTKGSKIAIAEAKSKNIIVVPSIEISSSQGHIIGFGVDVDIPKGLTPDDTIDKIYDNGGIPIIPHPFSFYRNGLFSSLSPFELNIEAIEVKNARYIFGYSNYKSRSLARKKNLAEIGASDSHFIDSIGDSYTEIRDIDSDPTIDNIIDAIRFKKTIAKGKKTSNFLIAKEVFNKKFNRTY